MKNWNKHIRINFVIFFSAITLFLISCKENNSEKEVIIAQVGNSILSEKDIDSSLVDKKYANKYKTEFIKNWIETEVLKQFAIDKKLLNKNNYRKILDDTGKELAAAIAINNFLDENKIIFNNKDLISFFKRTKNNFKLNSKVYIVNLISFSDETKAIKFRNEGILNGWNNAVNLFKNDSSIVKIESNKIYNDFHIQSQILSRILKGLYLNEVSPVIKTELNNFVVVQEIDKFQKGSIPDFKYIRDKVEERYLIIKQKKLVRDFIDSLITVKNVKIY